MKRKPLLLAIALMLVIGAALWGVNWRLDHPPLSEADKQFRALVAGADSVEVSQWSCQKQTPCAATATLEYKPLNVAQTRELIENLRLSDTEKSDAETISPFAPGSIVTLDFIFHRKSEGLLTASLLQTSHLTALSYSSPSHLFSFRQLNPRFEKPLNRYLDQVLPQRVRP